MQAYFADGVEIDRCPFCGGMWFDGGELEQLLAQPVPVEPLGGATTRRCVACMTTLETGVFRGVPLEVCGTCLSIYLDDGELKELARREIPLARANALAEEAPELSTRCVGCGDRVPLDEALTTTRGLSCRNCFGMLDHSVSPLSPAGGGEGHADLSFGLLDAATTTGTHWLLTLVLRLFSSANR
jgi:Zn-finger nucleic acid-binding protein